MINAEFFEFGKLRFEGIVILSQDRGGLRIFYCEKKSYSNNAFSKSTLNVFQ